jgi:hypothetical protein
MKAKQISGNNILNIIGYLESDLSKLKRALAETGRLGGSRKALRSVRKYEFCGMWKNRDDMKGLSTAEWLVKLRREQWSRSQ